MELKVVQIENELKSKEGPKILRIELIKVSMILTILVIIWRLVKVITNYFFLKYKKKNEEIIINGNSNLVFFIY